MGKYVKGTERKKERKIKEEMEETRTKGQI